MKKSLAILLVTVLIMSVFVGMVSASVYDMWKGEFTHIYNTSQYPDAGGEAIFNYVKGSGTYIVNIKLHGLKPNQAYQVYLLDGALGQKANRQQIGTLTTKDDGTGRIHEREVSINLGGTNPRVVLFHNIDNWSWVIKTPDGSLSAEGSNRGE